MIEQVKHSDIINSLASVIIVTCNSKQFLDRCLNSVLIQGYPHEVILVDNIKEVLEHALEEFDPEEVI